MISFNLFIKTNTWARDSHELFDYESQQVTFKQIKITREAVCLYRESMEIYAKPQSDLFGKEKNGLCNMNNLKDQEKLKHLDDEKNKPILYVNFCDRQQTYSANKI